MLAEARLAWQHSALTWKRSRFDTVRRDRNTVMIRKLAMVPAAGSRGIHDQGSISSSRTDGREVITRKLAMVPAAGGAGQARVLIPME